MKRRFDITHNPGDRTVIAGFSGEADGMKIGTYIVEGDQYTIEEAMKLLRQEYNRYSADHYSNLFIYPIRFRVSSFTFTKEEILVLHQHGLPLYVGHPDEDEFCICYLEDIIVPNNKLPSYVKTIVGVNKSELFWAIMAMAL